MSTSAVIRSGVGLRHVQILALDSDNYPKATGATAYGGVTLSGAVSLALTDPEPQQIVHRGDDRVFALDVLPPTDAISGELSVSKTNDTVDAVLTDDKSFDIGEASMFGLGTDTRGDENQVAILAYRQTLDTDPSSGGFGTRRWEFRLIPKTYVIPRATGLEQDTSETRSYTVRPQFVKEHLWGEAFSSGTEGFLQAQMLRGIAVNKPKVVAWKATTAGDGEVTLEFPSGAPASATGKIATWVDGVRTTAETVATTQVTFTTGAVTTNAMVVAFYEID